LASAELFNPISGTFTNSGNMTVARAWHKATLLDDGTYYVLVFLRKSGWREIAIALKTTQFASITLASAKPGDPTSKASRPAPRFSPILSSPCFDGFPRKSMNRRGK
jgi:hypothetical protein